MVSIRKLLVNIAVVEPMLPTWIRSFSCLYVVVHVVIQCFIILQRSLIHIEKRFGYVVARLTVPSVCVDPYQPWTNLMAMPSPK